MVSVVPDGYPKLPSALVRAFKDQQIFSSVNLSSAEQQLYFKNVQLTQRELTQREELKRLRNRKQRDRAKGQSTKSRSLR